MTEPKHDESLDLPALEANMAAFYQPIVALDTRTIIGYEVLGRRRTNEGYASLGPFFADARIPVSHQIRVDRMLREQALMKLSGIANPPKLFLNLKPSWIYTTYRQTGELPTLRLIESHQIDPRNIVIEVTEEASLYSDHELRSIVDLYRSKGCQIAIDDVGSGFSSLDRIAALQPNLLKVDIHMMKQSASHSGYLGVLRSFSTLAEQIGASLLIEGVETQQDLRRAIQVGARYVQGFLFAQAGPEFLEDRSFQKLVDAELRAHRKQFMAAEQYWKQQGKQLNALLQQAIADDAAGAAGRGSDSAGAGAEAEARAVAQVSASASLGLEADHETSSDDRFIERLLGGLCGSCIRVYVCSEDGMQTSANYSREADGRWQREAHYRGAHWGWRPYFFPNLVQMKGKRQSILSRPYADLESWAWIRTWSAFAGNDRLIFFDMLEPSDQHV